MVFPLPLSATLVTDQLAFESGYIRWIMCGEITMCGFVVFGWPSYAWLDCSSTIKRKFYTLVSDVCMHISLSYIISCEYARQELEKKYKHVEEINELHRTFWFVLMACLIWRAETNKTCLIRFFFATNSTCMDKRIHIHKHTNNSIYTHSSAFSGFFCWVLD